MTEERSMLQGQSMTRSQPDTDDDEKMGGDAGDGSSSPVVTPTDRPGWFANLPAEQWLAVALSMISPGVGQIYCGALRRGLTCFCLMLLFVPTVATAALIDVPTVNLLTLAIATLIFLGVYFFALLDTLRVSRPEYNRSHIRLGISVYLMLCVVGFANPLTSIFLVRNSVFEVFYIPTSSMVPTFTPGDYVIANKLFAATRMPDRGSLVIFRNPTNRRQRWIKRVVALPGDTVEVKGHQVLVNGRTLTRDPLPNDAIPLATDKLSGQFYEEVNSGKRYRVLVDESQPAVEFPQQKVPPGTVFVLGDHRGNSRDSRVISFVPLGEVIGRIQSIILPAQSWQRFGPF